MYSFTSMQGTLLVTCREYQILDFLDDEDILQRAYTIQKLLSDHTDIIDRLFEKTIYFVINYLRINQLGKYEYEIKLITYFILLEHISPFIEKNQDFIYNHIQFLINTKEFLYYYKQDIKELDELDGIMYVHMFLIENDMKYSIANSNIKSYEYAQYIFSQLFTIRRKNQYITIYVDNYRHCRIQTFFQYNEVPLLENNSELNRYHDGQTFIIANTRCFDFDFKQKSLAHISISNVVPENLQLAQFNSLRSITLHCVQFFLIDEQFQSIQFPNLIHLSLKQVSDFNFNSLNYMGFQAIEYINIQQCQIHPFINVSESLQTLKILKIQSNETYQIYFDVCPKNIQILSLEKGIIQNLYFRHLPQLIQFISHAPENITQYTLSKKMYGYLYFPQHVTYEQQKLVIPMFDSPHIDSRLQIPTVQGLVQLIKLIQFEYYQTLVMIRQQQQNATKINNYINMILNL